MPPLWFRLAQQGVDEVNESTPDIMSCDESRKFWLDWEMAGNRRLVRVGQGDKVGSNTFMSYEDNNPFNIQYVGVSSGHGSDGTWSLDGFCRGGWINCA